jgi:hypothetical protein
MLFTCNFGRINNHSGQSIPQQKFFLDRKRAVFRYNTGKLKVSQNPHFGIVYC